MTPAPWHSLDAGAALARLSVDPGRGLSGAEAAERLERFGPNELAREDRASALALFLGQFKNVLMLILLAAIALSALVGEVVDAAIIGLIVVFCAILGFLQEFRAEKALEALKNMLSPSITALRDGVEKEVPSTDLVPGDILLLEAGDKVPADARVLESHSLRCDEAALTGESAPVGKNPAALPEAARLADRRNMAFTGTSVTYGRGRALVVETGMHTAFGAIAREVAAVATEKTPLEKRTGEIGKWLGLLALGICGLVAGVSILRQALDGKIDLQFIVTVVMFAISLAVAAVPEALAAIVTGALAIGMRQMARKNALVRKMPAVETLGCTTVICSDKTGTLTRNEMTVQALWTPQDGTVAVDGVGYEPVGGFTPELPEAGRSLLEAGVLCNDASLQEESGRWTVTGDPTEGALLTAAEKAGLKVSDVRQESPRLDAIPFESENQFMATLHRVGEASVLLLKGAPEVILSRCSEVEAKEVHEQVVGMASRGIRVLAFARKELPQNRAEVDLEDTATGFRFLGLQGMIDPPRSEAIEAIRDCHRAGITVKMITGDHQATAQSIGEQLGLRSEIPVIVGRDLGRMDEAALTDALRRCHVFARVAPEHKLRLVKSLQNQGEVVAMTGDGVNDAPALKQANIGVAMGITGTSVSKQAADLVLTDDNFASIRAAVEEGRRVYDNLIKSLAFVLPTNLGLALILTWGVAFFPFDPRTGELLLPMLPAQLLWVNLIASFFLATPLAFEAPEKDLMDRPPRRPGEPILGPFVLYRTIMVAILMTAGALLMFLDERSGAMAAGLAEAAAVSEAQTMAVTTVVMFQIFYLLNCRSLKHSLLTVGMWSNPVLYLGIAILAVLQALFIYFPPMNAVFDTVPLQAADLGKAALVGATILPVVAVEKAWRNWRART